jgi:hypothetical protein
MVDLDADVTENDQKCEVAPANHAMYIHTFLLLFSLKQKLLADVEVLALVLHDLGGCAMCEMPIAYIYFLAHIGFS